MKTIFKEKFGIVGERIAKKMTERFERFSPAQKKWLLGVFCAMGLVASIGVFKTAVAVPQQMETGKPAATPHLGKNNPEAAPVQISPRIYDRMEHIKRYLDSLQHHDSTAYKDIMLRYPHLQDSIAFFEKIYQSQQKK